VKADFNVKRRLFLCNSTATLLMMRRLASAQSAARVARVGYLINANRAAARPYVEAFLQGLRDLGWIEGSNVQVEYRWADGDLDQLPALALELMKLPVDVLVTSGPDAVRAAAQASSTIPIVAAIMPDPVALGFAASLSRPGGNVTGLANLFEVLTPKQLQIFKETLPRAERIAMLSDFDMAPAIQSATEAAARRLGIEAQVYQVRKVAEFDAAIGKAKAQHADGVHVLPSPLFNANRKRIAELATMYRLPSISEAREYVLDGGLMSYGPNFPGMYRSAARYVDRILKGARPAEMPIEQPTKFELVLNLRTARVLGLVIPQIVLLRADEAIG
jgi:putative ABC transport system substrate-binding protein